MPQGIDGREALQRLRDGNARFVGNVLSIESLLSHVRRAEQARAQQPFAVILGCSDSRAPAEFIFDQGLGDLFVIRVAGNIAAPSQIGSVEFAVARFGIRLVVVLGHSYCGAVLATIDHCRTPARSSPGLLSIVSRIQPALQPLVEAHCNHESEDGLVARAVRANVRSTVHVLRSSSRLLEDLIRNDSLHIVGADYDLASGVVDFFDDVPEA